MLREMEAGRRAVLARALEERAHRVLVRRVEGVRRGRVGEVARRPRWDALVELGAQPLDTPQHGGPVLTEDDYEDA